MQSLYSMGKIYTSITRYAGAILLAAIASYCVLQPQVDAAVFSSGDVLPQQEFVDVPIGGQLVTLWVPDLPSGGGRVTVTVDDGMGGTTDQDAPLIVGGTGVFSGMILSDGTEIGTTIGEVSINNPTGTLPLIAIDVTIGLMANGVGRVTLNDFGTTMIAENVLTIGDEGQGELRLTNGSRVNVGMYNNMDFRYEGGETIIGSQIDTSGSDQFVSEGIVSLDGFGTLLESDIFTVADEGLATVDISGKANLVTLETIVGGEVGSRGEITLTGLGTRWNNLEFIPGGGSDAGKIILGDSGTGILNINDQAVVSADALDINPISFVNLGGGTLYTNDPIDNNGVIRGYGRIESALDINSAGELRNKADVETIREYMYVAGPVTNNGTIESLGGEMEFESTLTNNFELIARDAVMRFNGLLNNAITGDIVIGGDTTIHSVGTILSEGGIHVLAGSEALIVGDLTFTADAIPASKVLSLTAGDAPGTLDVVGTVDLGGATLELDYSAGVASQIGDTYQILSSTNPIVGMFSNPGDIVVADGREWSILGYGTSSIYVTATGVLAPILPGDFNGDGVCDGADFLVWQAGFGTLYDENDLADWEDCMTPSFAASASVMVPEPNSAMLLLMGSVLLGACSYSRKRR